MDKQATVKIMGVKERDSAAELFRDIKREIGVQPADNHSHPAGGINPSEKIHVTFKIHQGFAAGHIQYQDDMCITRVIKNDIFGFFQKHQLEVRVISSKGMQTGIKIVAVIHYKYRQCGGVIFSVMHMFFLSANAVVIPFDTAKV